MQIQHQRATLAGIYCEIAGQALDEENLAIAALNYRRATIVAPNSDAGLTAARAIGEIQQNAEAELKEVDRLVAAQEFDEAIQCVDRLRREYAALAIAPKIEQARRRVLRLQQASVRDAKPEPRMQTEPAADRAAALAHPQDTETPAASGRGTVDSIRKLAGLTQSSPPEPRLRGSERR